MNSRPRTGSAIWKRIDSLATITTHDIETLWQSFKEHPGNSRDLDLHHLQAICRRQGLHIDRHQLKNAFGLNRDRESISHGQFCSAMASLLGDRSARVSQAFAYLDREDKGLVTTDDFLRVAKAFAGDDERCALLAAELDANGDGFISAEDFRNYVPDTFALRGTSYRSSHLPAGEHREKQGAADSGRTDPGTSPPLDSTLATAPSLGGMVGSSPLQLRIGFFRLLQGAAYRSFRENYTANSETHLKARDLPYAIGDFANFVSAAVAFYLGLGVVEAGCEHEFLKLDALVQRQLDQLEQRISNWPGIEKTPAMLAAQAGIDAERNELEDHRHLFMAVIEFMLSLQSNALSLEHLAEELLAHHEINRLRQLELTREPVGKQPDTSVPGSSPDYLDSWNRVIIDSRDEKIDGAIMPTRFWYEEFMPQLLRCCSINTVAELQAMDAETEADLDDWFAAVAELGAFEHFAADLRDGFPACTRQVKQELKQAWVLTEHYLNGIQKRREREEMGRDSGYLSEYVAFIDHYLGRNDVQAAAMRLSFPYYIGPAVWRLLHTAAELIEAMPAAERAQGIARFTTFFATFATMYPCPYCRYHLNRYVVQNREVSMYPVEYLFLGQRPKAGDLHVSISDKLASIRAGQAGSLRLFVWKLHNTVSSSIARTEPWFHRDPKPHYTTRYWPSMDSELARAHALGRLSLELDRLVGIYGVLKPAARLAVLRDELQAALHQDNQDEIDRLHARALEVIADLEEEITASNYLQRHYHYDPALASKPPHFTEEEEMFARSGLYVED